MIIKHALVSLDNIVTFLSSSIEITYMGFYIGNVLTKEGYHTGCNVKIVFESGEEWQLYNVLVSYSYKSVKIYQSKELYDRQFGVDNDAR